MTDLNIDLTKLNGIRWDRGVHPGGPQEGCCIMEAVPIVAGGPFSDHDDRVCPVIGTFLRGWWDAQPDNDTRLRLMPPETLLPLIIGTKGTPETEQLRSMLAIDWLVRAHTTAWLSLVPALQPHADVLAALAPIVDLETAIAAGPKVRAAWAAAWAAAGDALRPTVELLQADAGKLLDRMIEASA